MSQSSEHGIPNCFFDFSGRCIRVERKKDHYPDEPEWRCPRGCGDKTEEVYTSEGVWLYCFGCRIFYPEFGMWGYKNNE